MHVSLSDDDFDDEWTSFMLRLSPLCLHTELKLHSNI